MGSLRLYFCFGGWCRFWEVGMIKEEKDDV